MIVYGKMPYAAMAVETRSEVLAPIDPNAPEVRLRRDVLAQYHDRLKEG